MDVKVGVGGILYYISIYNLLKSKPEERFDANKISEIILTNGDHNKVSMHRLRDVLNKMHKRNILDRYPVTVGRIHKFEYQFRTKVYKV